MKAKLLVFYFSFVVVLSGIGYCSDDMSSYEINDWNFKVGVKSWYNKADLDLTVKNEKTSGTDSAIMSGLSVFASHKKFFGGINYLTTVDDYDGVDRDDLDLMIGYIYKKNIGFILGYKNMKLEGHGIEITVNSPVLGIYFNKPVNISNLNNPLFLNAAVSFMPFMDVDMDVDMDAGSISMESDEAYGYAIDLSASYPINRWVLNAGYKYEFHTSDFDETEENWAFEYEEFFHGPYMSIFYNF